MMVNTSATAKAVTIAKPILAAFQTAKLDTIVSGKLSHLSDDATVRPSDIRQDKDVARAGMGAKATPVSFMSGLLFLTCAFAHGQGKADALRHGLPEVAAYAFDRATENLKGGAGISAASLKTAVIAAMTAVCALPVRKAPAKVAIASGAVIDGTAKRINTAQSGMAIDRSGFVWSLDQCHTFGAGFDLGNGQALSAARQKEVLAAEAAKVAAEAASTKVPQGTDDGEKMTALFARWLERDNAQAVEALREIALAAGYRLVKVPAKKAA